MYYGFRYYSGITTNTGFPNRITGRFSIAGETVFFKNKDDLDRWLSEEDRGKPSGLGGGKRIELTVNQLADHHNGRSVKEYTEWFDTMTLLAEQNGISNENAIKVRNHYRVQS